MKKPGRIAVFASGGGTNLQSLLDRFNSATSAIGSVQLVVGSREGIGALDRARAAGVDSVVIDPDVEGDRLANRLLAELEQRAIDLVVLAGYLKLVPLEVVRRFQGRMLNIHPALLPAFGGPGMYGMRVHRAVIEAGARVSGATVHLVGERYDEGPIVAQWPVPVLSGDTPERLAARVLRAEHLLLPIAVERVLAEELPRQIDSDFAFDLVQSSAPPIDSLKRLHT